MKKKITTRVAGYLFVVYYLVGLVGLSLPGTRNVFISLMPLSLLLSTAVLLLFHRHWRSNDVLVLIAIAITGYLIEVVGVLTGHVFGTYWYGNALGTQVFDTPLIIGINWMMLVYCTFAIMESTRLFWPVKAIAAAILMVAYDAVMEPVAMRLDMWNWETWHWEYVLAPIRNYQAWFIISLLLLTAMHLSRIRTGNLVAPWLFWVQFIFFLTLNLTLRIF